MNNIFKLFSLLIVAILMVPGIFQPGLFMDGLIYATLGHNLANGIGTFWHPSFSGGVMQEFYEHPPLAFGIQAIFFKILGGGFWVEKLYSFITAILTGSMIIGLWRKQEAEETRSFYWLPILLWITVQPVNWAYNNNMLENTLSLFSLGAVYLLYSNINAKPGRQVIISLLASTLLIMSFLSKGFPGLFPLGFFFCYYLAYHRTYSIRWMIRKTALLLGAFILLSASLFIFNQNATDGIMNYLAAQLLPALEGVDMQKPWYHIMRALALQTSGIIALSVILILSYYRLKVKKLFDHNQRRSNFALWVFIGLTATAPIMISPKQLTFYIVPSIPYFALAFAGLSVHIVHSYFQRIRVPRALSRSFNTVLLIAILGIVANASNNYGEPLRDKALLSDVHKIGSTIPQGSLISIDKPLSQHWSLMGYLQRYYFIGLDRSGERHEYHLNKKAENIPLAYQPVDIGLEGFVLSLKAD